MKLIKKTFRATTTYLARINSFDERDWKISLIQNLKQPATAMAKKDLKGFVVIVSSIIKAVEYWLETCPGLR